MLLWDVFDIMSMPPAKRNKYLIAIACGLAIVVVVALVVTYAF